MTLFSRCLLKASRLMKSSRQKAVVEGQRHGAKGYEQAQRPSGRRCEICINRNTGRSQLLAIKPIRTDTWTIVSSCDGMKVSSEKDFVLHLV